MKGSHGSAITRRKRRWVDFYDKQSPLSHLFIIHYTPGLGIRPWPHHEQKAARIEWAWQKYGIQMEQLPWLNDDTLPFLDVYTGTEIFAEAFGCPVSRPGNDMPFARPLIQTAAQADRLAVPDFGSTALAELFEIADELRRRAGNEALVRMIDLQSPMDIAALIWEKASFYQAMVDTPQAIKNLTAKVRALLIAFLDEWFRRYGKEFIAHYPDYYMPFGITLSEDEIGSVSTAMFVDFFLPELTDLSNRYGSIGMHCCANARHQWDNFRLIPNLRMLNLVQPDQVIKDAYPYFAMLAPQMHSFGGDGPAWEWPKRYPQNARVVMDITVETKDEARRVCDRLRQN